MIPEQLTKVEADRRAILAAKQKGRLATAATYVRLSGPGWLQSALTLGGGSLGGSLYLGALAGFSLLWLQPFAMILGVIMLSAIGYVAMSTEQRPFVAINRHVNPVLGWGWALASLAANMVWCLPQYSLASGVLQQNLLPGLLGKESALGEFWGAVVISAGILLITLVVTWAYDSGGRGIKLYELFLKLIVAMIVFCFIGVVAVITLRGALDWRAVFSGFVPDLTTVYKPAATFNWLLDAVPDREFWSRLIVSQQQDVIITAAATAVGINMTFLLPYSMLRRGWDKQFRGLAKFDLATGMFIPFVLATSCVVIASASQFHPLRPTPEQIAAIQPGARAELPELDPELAWEPVQEWLGHRLGAPTTEWLRSELILGEPTGALKAEFDRFVEVRNEALEEMVKEWIAHGALPEEPYEAWQDKVLQQLEKLTRSEKVLIWHLQRKDAFDLAKSLAPLTGRVVADVLFGVGVVGMTLSSITLLMLISGFVICEMLGLPPKGWPNRLGALAAATGVLGPFLWSSKFWAVVPTSVFCFTLLPFAYLTFFFVMNSKSLLGEEMPRGARRVAWNLGMGVAAMTATVASVYMVWQKARLIGLAAVVALALLVIVVHFAFPRNAAKN